MMRKIAYTIAVLACFAVLVSGCGRGQGKDENSAYGRFQELAEQYVEQELRLASLDSVRVVKVDTVDNYEYAQIIVALLYKMNDETMEEYHRAVVSGDMAEAKNLEVQVDEIAAAGQQWEMEEQAAENAPKSFRFYLITANYYNGMDCDQFYFFATQDFKIHIPDPFEEL